MDGREEPLRNSCARGCDHGRGRQAIIFGAAQKAAVYRAIRKSCGRFGSG